MFGAELEMPGPGDCAAIYLPVLVHRGCRLPGVITSMGY